MVDDSLDNLFKELDEANKAITEVAKADTDIFVDNDDGDDGLLKLDDDAADKEQTFRDIEKNLQKLPKFETSFDNLGVKETTESKKQKLREALLKNTGVQKVQEKTKASEDWFTIPKMSDGRRKEIERDLILIKHRNALDPKQHYKKQKWTAPDRISVGTIIEDSTEFFSSRMTNKERKSTMLETLMSNGDRKNYFKRKYDDIQLKKMSGKKGHFKKMKALRKSKH